MAEASLLLTIIIRVTLKTLSRCRTNYCRRAIVWGLSALVVITPIKGENCSLILTILRQVSTFRRLVILKFVNIGLTVLITNSRRVIDLLSVNLEYENDFTPDW